MQNIIKKVEEAIGEIISKNGYEIVDIECEKKYDVKNLTIYIDIPSGVSLDDCEKVHYLIEPVIEELNLFGEESYVLNISSPGLDRPFKKHRDYERNYQKEVEVKLYTPLKGKKYFEGILAEHTDNTITIIVKGEEIKLENSKVALVRPLVKFN